MADKIKVHAGDFLPGPSRLLKGKTIFVLTKEHRWFGEKISG